MIFWGLVIFWWMVDQRLSVMGGYNWGWLVTFHDLADSMVDIVANNMPNSLMINGVVGHAGQGWSIMVTRDDDQ